MKNVYSNMDVAEQQTEIDSSSISKCCKGKRMTAGGYHWMYLDEWLAQQEVNVESFN